MASPQMGFFSSIKLGIFVIVLGLGVLTSVESTIFIRFDRAPRAFSRFSTAVFKYSVKKPDGSNPCENKGCLIQCELDGQTMSKCPADTIVVKNLTVNRAHKFVLNVTTTNGERNSSAYSWFIDKVPPTATILSQENYTSAQKVTIDITFSEACSGRGGFKCLNSSNCDVVVYGPAQVQASSLSIVKPNVKYSLDVIISSNSTYGHIVVSVADKFCTDLAGNHFERTNASTVIIHFDRRPVVVDLWTSVPSHVLGINGVLRTVLAANEMQDLEIFLDFSVPVFNSTNQILNALHVNSGNIMPTRDSILGNRRFVFELKNMSTTEIVTIKLEAGLLIGRTGTPVLPVAPLTFLYDSTRPQVGLSTSSPKVTKESNINVIAEFTKPVFGFDASMVQVDGGKLTRFMEISRALYSLTVKAMAENVVSIRVLAGKVNDVSGNLNLASNKLEVELYKTPAISVALHSFVTAGILATSSAAAFLSLSSENLGALGTLNSASTKIIASNPSMNLHGMIGHLQVFVLSDWIISNQPIEYSETTKGLRWLIPRQKLPWKKNSSSIWPSNIYFSEEKITENFTVLSTGFPSHERAYNQIDLYLTKSFGSLDEPPVLAKTDPEVDWLHRKLNLSMKNTPYGQPLDSNEYFTYFLRGEPLSASNVVKKMENNKGWQDLEMNLFWLGIGAGSLVTIHLLILLFLKWRTKTPANGILSVPRFELLILILLLPCIAQSSAFVIRGGSMWGIITGSLLLVIPGALILSIFVFLKIAIFPGRFAYYKEIRHVATYKPWYKKTWFYFTARPTTGKWFYREGLPSSFLLRFGIFFENRKGPAFVVFVDENDPNTITKWTESGQSGIGRMRAVGSDDSNEEIKIPSSRRLLGCARSSYIIVDLLRRVGLGILSAATNSSNHSNRFRQCLFALTLTLIQFVYLVILRPYITRGIHVVESISLLCEICLFGLSININGSNPIKAKYLGALMLSLLLITFVAQVVNEWYALLKSLLWVSHPQRRSLMVGLKFAVKGFVLLFFPRKYWSRVIPELSRPKTGLAPVVPLSPEPEFERRQTRASRVDVFSSMTATVVPVLSPGSPSLNVNQMVSSSEETTATRQRGEDKEAKGPKLESKDDMKKLRELAKASFSRDTKSKEASTSYAIRGPVLLS